MPNKAVNGLLSSCKELRSECLPGEDSSSELSDELSELELELEDEEEDSFLDFFLPGMIRNTF